MSRNTTRGIFCLATQLLLVASAALADDSFYSAKPANVGIDLSNPNPLSNRGIDRLLTINDTAYSLAKVGQTSVIGMTGDSAASVVEDNAPFSVEVSTGPSSGTLVLGACGAMLALGLGLCCAGMMSNRQRTVPTFTAGFVRVKK